MLVPEQQQLVAPPPSSTVVQQQNGHVISMYLATCGASGHLLGSDEKEIIYLVFGIIDLQNKEVSDHRHLARLACCWSWALTKATNEQSRAASSEQARDRVPLRNS